MREPIAGLWIGIPGADGSESEYEVSSRKVGDIVLWALVCAFFGSDLCR